MLSSAGLVSLMPLIFSSLATVLLISEQSWFESLDVLQWTLLFALTSLTMALAITPTTFIALASGYFLGWAAAPGMIVAYLTASMIGFGLGLRLDGGRLLQGMGDHSRFRQLVDEMQTREFAMMILVRISPVLPFSLINLLLPATGIRFRTFVVAGFIGMLPRTLFSIWAGQQAYSLVTLLQQPGEQVEATLLLVVTGVVSVGGLLWIVQRAWVNSLQKQSGSY